MIKKILVGTLLTLTAMLTAAPANASCATWCSGRTGSDWYSCMVSCQQSGSGY